MNQTKNKYESLLTLHYKLCRSGVNELREIGKQISDVLQFVEKYKLFPVDLSEHFRKQLALICEGGGSNEQKLEISKEIYLYLGKMMFSFEESNIIKMEPYAKLLELNRTEFSYEQANDWGSEVEIGNILDKDCLFFTVNRRHILLSSEDEYIAYYNELRKEPFDINGAFADECKLPFHLYSTVEEILRECYRKCSEYIEKHYSLISKECFMDQRTVLELNAKEARKYLMQSSSYCTVNLPEYYDFTNVLSFVRQKLGSRTLESCLAQRKKRPSEYEGVNHHLLTNKDGKYAFRRLQLANPYLYYLLVRTITEPNNWTLIQQHFVNRKRPTIEVTSLPKVKKSRRQAQAGVDIPVWWEDYEQESIALALQYQYVFVTDIADCYGSIYTHTIPWSLYGKDYAKTHRAEKNLGNDVDRYMCAMNYDQTNGIPQGSVLFDLIAEIILAYADFCLYERLGTKDIYDEDYHILRYRDDYRVFANSKEKLEVIVQTLQEVLIDLNFRMNTSKTHLSEEVVLDSIKKDKLAYLTQPPVYDGKDSNFSTIQKELLFILLFAKEHPNSGMVARLLSKLLNRIEDDGLEKENPRVLISIAVETMMSSPRVFNVGTALISYFLNKVEEGKEEIVKSVYSKLRRMSNTGELEIWLQRITYHLNDVNIAYDEGLTKIVAGQQGVVLWNNDWVKPELFQGFPIFSICDVQKRDEQTPIIPAVEVSFFEY